MIISEKLMKLRLETMSISTLSLSIDTIFFIEIYNYPDKLVDRQIQVFPI